jgi:hypothetical protein
MTGDPKECRSNAARCAELAAAASTPQLRTTFLELSKNWEKLAIQLEDAFAKLTEGESVRLGRTSKSRSMKLSGFLIFLSGSDNPCRAQERECRCSFYLERAANASENAAVALDETTRKFHQAMESKWMNLAASTA